MEEQSHKHEMSAAVRADFARLRARGVVTTIAPDGSPEEHDAASAGEPERPRRWWRRPEADGTRRG
jgi:hypothetical protein